MIKYKYSIFVFLIFSIIYTESYSLNFDGDDDYVSFESFNNYNYGNSFNLSFDFLWDGPNSFSDQHWSYLVCHGWSTNNALLIEIEDSGLLMTSINWDEGRVNFPVVENNWYHYELVYNEGIMSVYINGILVGIDEVVNPGTELLSASA